MTGPGRGGLLTYPALRLFGQAAEFGGFLLLARRLSPESFGQLAVAFLVCRYAGIIGDWGALTRGARDVAADDDKVVALVRLRTRLTCAAAVLVAAGMVATDNAAFVPIIATTFALGMNRDWLALGRGEPIRAAVPGACQGLALIVLSVTVSSTSSGARAVGLAYGIGGAASLVLNRAPQTAGSGEHRAPDAWLLVGYVAIQFTSSADTLLLATIHSSAEAGVYAAVYRLPNAWLALLTAVVGGAIPIATRAVDAGEAEHLRRRALRTAARTAAIVLATAPVVWFAVPFVYGAAYVEGRPAVVVLVIATAVCTFGVPLHVFQVARRGDRVYAEIMVAGAIANLALNLMLIPGQSMLGAALATLAAQLVVTGLLIGAQRGRSTPAAARE